MESLVYSKLLPWTLREIYERMGQLSPKTVSVTCSLLCLDSLAECVLVVLILLRTEWLRSLLHFVLRDDHVTETVRSIKQLEPIISMTLVCYATVVKYTIARYNQGSASTLKKLCRYSRVAACC